MNWSEFFLIFTPGAVIGTIIFALITGGTYGWRSRGEGTLELGIIGLGFIIVQVAAIPDVPVARYVARALLWVLLIALLGAGRWLRLRLEIWRVRRKLEKIED